MKDFWSYDKDAILKQLNSSENGLSTKEAEDRIEKYGKNVFEEKKSTSKFMIFLSQFKSPITMILIFAAILSIFLKDYSDGVIILIIILISSFLSYLHESKAKDAVKKTPFFCKCYIFCFKRWKISRTG
ncbi:cation transporter/ATPase N-terminal domain protein [Peptoniphilus sp. BV3C26]|nr:cation transporter/ATPase N-terminal domain protein [Peptoniphilus sp. BV3C26]